MAGEQRIAEIHLEEERPPRRAPVVEHERAVAIYDLLEENRFEPAGGLSGPYAVYLKTIDNRLNFDIRGSADGRTLCRFTLPMSPLRRIVKDYFMICETYHDAIRKATPARIETIDMARRGLHNEGAEQLRTLMADRVSIDENTARRLFTLVCVLHIRG